MANSILYNSGVALTLTAAQIANNPLIGANAAAYSGDNIQLIERTIDVAQLLTTINPATGAAAYTTGIGDTLDLFPVPNRSIILAVALEVIKADTNSTATVALATTQFAASWVAATAMSAANVNTGMFSANLASLIVATSAAPVTVPTLRATIGTAALTNSIFRAVMVIAPIARSDNNRNQTTFS